MSKLWIYISPKNKKVIITFSSHNSGIFLAILSLHLTIFWITRYKLRIVSCKLRIQRKVRIVKFISQLWTFFLRIAKKAELQDINTKLFDLNCCILQLWLFSQNCEMKILFEEFISCNFMFISHNWPFFTQNCEFISSNSEFEGISELNFCINDVKSNYCIWFNGTIYARM